MIGCAQVNFEETKVEQSISFSADTDDSFPEFFKMAVGGMVDQPDQTGEILLSASVAALPTMEISMDTMGEISLTTGFTTIVSTNE